MIKKLHLKSLLLIAALLVGSTSAWAVDQVYKTLTFTNADATKNQSYDGSWTETVGTSPNTFSWTITNFNNNNWGWTDGNPALYVIKCGRKYIGKGNNITYVPSKATITTNTAIDEAITKVVVSLTAIYANDYNSIKLYVASDEDFEEDLTTISVSPIPTSAGDMTITIPEANRAANRYYKLEFDTKGTTTSNGHTGVKKVEYYYDYVSTASLQSISLSGTYPTEFFVGDAFSHEGVTVTANYSDNTSIDVTDDATFSTPDMTTAGTREVTVSYTEGSVTKEATYNIVVSPVPSVVLTLDFSKNIFGLGDKTTAQNSYQYGGYTYTLAGGGSGNGYYAPTSGSDYYLLMGKEDCTLTLPAYPFIVKKIKVYGRSGASASGRLNIFVGSTAIGTDANTQDNNEFNIPSTYQAVETRYVIKSTANANIQITKIEIFGDAEPIAVSEHGFATFASDNVLDFTNVPDITAYIAKEESGAITLTKVNKVPAGTGVLLRSDNGTTAFAVPFTTAATDDVTDNLFVRGTEAAVSYGEGPYNYVLSIVNNKIGFYKANNNTVATNRAYLQTTIAAGARIEIDGMTGITGVNLNENQNENRYYDLQGRYVTQPTKGLYIVNGRKVVIK